jgi:hypothetical protein
VISKGQNFRCKSVTSSKVNLFINCRLRKDGENLIINVTNQVHNHRRFGSPGLFNQGQKPQGAHFIGEMKKHGIYDAFNDINVLSEFLDALPSKEGKFIEITNTPGMRINDQKEEAKYSHIHAQKGTPFLFPFQRRARSYSPPSEEQINNKIAEAISNNLKNEKERSWSKSIEAMSSYKNQKNQSPVVANTSFMIGGAEFQKSKRLGDRTRKYINKKEIQMMKEQEVEDWL